MSSPASAILAAVLELFFRLAFKVFAYVLFKLITFATGLLILSLLAPNVHIEPMDDMNPWVPPGSRGFSYTENGERFLYGEIVSLIGTLFWIFVGVLSFVLYRKYAL